jgi:hypothetical protein
MQGTAFTTILPPQNAGCFVLNNARGWDIPKVPPPPTPGPRGPVFLSVFFGHSQAQIFQCTEIPKIPKAHYIRDFGRYNSDFYFNFFSFLFFFTTFYKYDEYKYDEYGGKKNHLKEKEKKKNYL